jgi:hypothetical protein
MGCHAMNKKCGVSSGFCKIFNCAKLENSASILSHKPRLENHFTFTLTFFSSNKYSPSLMSKNGQYDYLLVF